MQEREPKPKSEPDIREIYAQLKRGVGHEHVTDANAGELIAMAREYGDTDIETLLREWLAPCSPHSGKMPSTIAPTPGFNREHVKHR
ncbi:MAG: hypothetical protein AB1666_14140 [Pseudomonadota bacterium]